MRFAPNRRSLDLRAKQLVDEVAQRMRWYRGGDRCRSARGLACRRHQRGRAAGRAPLDERVAVLSLEGRRRRRRSDLADVPRARRERGVGSRAITSKAYLFTVARRRLADHFRAQARRATDLSVSSVDRSRDRPGHAAVAPPQGRAPARRPRAHPARRSDRARARVLRGPVDEARSPACSRSTRTPCAAGSRGRATSCATCSPGSGRRPRLRRRVPAVSASYEIVTR